MRAGDRIRLHSDFRMPSNMQYFHLNIHPYVYSPIYGLYVYFRIKIHKLDDFHEAYY